MNRRGFISNLAVMLGAAAGPNIIALEAFDRFKWRASKGGLVAVINPMWLEADYEIQFIMAREFAPFILKNS